MASSYGNHHHALATWIIFTPRASHEVAMRWFMCDWKTHRMMYVVMATLFFSVLHHYFALTWIIVTPLAALIVTSLRGLKG